MKKFFLIILISVFITNCSSRGKIQIKTDTFKNSSIVTLELKQSAKERPGILFGKYSLKTLYKKEIKDKKSNPVEIDIVIEGFPKEPGKLKNQAIFKIDNKSYSISLTDIKSSVSSVVGHTNLQTGFAYSTVYRSINAHCILNDEIKSKLLEGTDLIFRFYAGNKALTFKVKKKHLEKVKEFLIYERNVDEKLRLPLSP